jgi:glycosyltransferase involved in cell wall biosynthesis
MEPKVAVVIPAWDAYAGKGLLEAAASVRSQAAKAQLVVVDNASRIAVPALEGAEIVRLGRRLSTGAARNAALKSLRTPYVVFLDADDTLLPGALSALVEGLEDDPRRVVYVLSIIDAGTRTRHRSPRRIARALSRLPSVFAVANAVWSLLPTQGATVMRVDDVRACGGYADSDRGEDWVLGTSLAFRGRVAFDRRPGLCYRPREGSPGTGTLGREVLLASARRVRARIRDDPAVPSWARSAMPLIAGAQWAAARVAHPTYRRFRSLLRDEDLVAGAVDRELRRSRRTRP